MHLLQGMYIQLENNAHVSVHFRIITYVNAAFKIKEF